MSGPAGAAATAKVAATELAAKQEQMCTRKSVNSKSISERLDFGSYGEKQGQPVLRTDTCSAIKPHFSFNSDSVVYGWFQVEASLLYNIYTLYFSAEGKSEINWKMKLNFVILACFIRCFGSSWMENNVADDPSPQPGSL